MKCPQCSEGVALRGTEPDFGCDTETLEDIVADLPCSHPCHAKAQEVLEALEAELEYFTGVPPGVARDMESMRRACGVAHRTDVALEQLLWLVRPDSMEELVQQAERSACLRNKALEDR